jgi:MFS family permease
MAIYRAIDLSATPIQIGLIGSSFALLSLVAAIPIGRVADRVGSGPFIMFGLGLISLSSLAAAVSDSLVILAGCMAMLGLGQIMNLVAGQAMVANRGEPERREARFGIYTTAGSLGQFAGPAVAAIIASTDLVGLELDGSERLYSAQSSVFLFGAVAAMVAAGVAVIGLRGPGLLPRYDARTGDPELGLRSSAARIIRRPGMPSAMFVSISVISVVDLLITYLPVLGSARGWSVGVVAALLAVRAGSSLFSRLLIGVLQPILGRRRLLIGGMAVSAIALLTLSFVSSPVLLVGLMAVVGFGLGVVQPITIAWVANRAEPGERATALAIRLTGNRAALLLAPTAVGALAGSVGVGAIFWILGAATIIGAGAAARTPMQRDSGTDRATQPTPITSGERAP